MQERKILILCADNAARSQMAEAVFKKHAQGRYTVHSAGLQPREIHPLTLRVLAENGHDTSGLQPKGLSAFLGKMTFAHVIFLCDRTERSCPYAFPGTLSRLSWPFEDPVAFEGDEEGKLEKFREVFGAIEKKILAWLAEGGATGA